MSDSPDLVLENVCLPAGNGPVSIRIGNGRITEIASDVAPSPSTRTLDGRGGVVLPRFVDVHMHLDKTLMGEPWVPLASSSTLQERITSGERLVREGRRTSIFDRGGALLRSATGFGTQALRTHADVTPGLGTKAVEDVLALKQKWSDWVDIQVAAFPQAGVVHNSVEPLLEEALRLGCSVVGGLDPAGYDGDVEAHLRTVFGLAERFGAEVDIHLHDVGHLGLFELDRICEWTGSVGMSGRVTVSHAFALGSLPAAEVGPTVDRLARSAVTIVTAATGHMPVPRASQLWDAGVRLGLGSDNIHDSWAPYGRGDALELAFLFAYRNNLRTDVELTRALTTLTGVNAEILGMEPVTIEVGSPADLVVVSAENGAEAVASHPARVGVIHRGRVVTSDLMPQARATSAE